jgi:hypothetical protein
MVFDLIRRRLVSHADRRAAVRELKKFERDNADLVAIAETTGHPGLYVSDIGRLALYQGEACAIAGIGSVEIVTRQGPIRVSWQDLSMHPALERAGI